MKRFILFTILTLFSLATAFTASGQPGRVFTMDLDGNEAPFPAE